jgi:ElaB/YqjD/DUF883 family membrane-anchored ribosome-binding protein
MYETSETSKTNANVDFKSQGLNNVIDQASAAAHPVIDQFSAKAHDTVNRLASAASHGADNFEVRSDQISASSERLGNALRSQIRHRPVAALGVAVASGFIISWLLKSRVG